MKKLVLSLFVLSVVLMGCPGPNDSVDQPVVESPFEGVWTQTMRNNEGFSAENSLQFTKSTFVFTYDNNINGKGSFSGPYTFTETTITFNPNEGLDEDDLKYVPWTQNYEISGNRLYLEPKRTYDGSWYLIAEWFTKQ